MSAVPAAILLAALAAAALVAEGIAAVAAIAAGLFAVCLRARRRARWLYVSGALLSAASVLALSPLLAVEGSHPLWTGPTLPVLGPLDVTSEEVRIALRNALRLAAVGLAFAAYALLLDHDRLLRAAGFARRFALLVALGTRLVPTLERDAAGFVEALRGRGVQVGGLRGRARLLSPLLAASLERALNLAEAMEARGFGRPGATRAPQPRWRGRDRVAVAAAPAVVVLSVWL